jgi:hypothetical protein
MKSIIKLLTVSSWNIWHAFRLRHHFRHSPARQHLDTAMSQCFQAFYEDSLQTSSNLAPLIVTVQKMYQIGLHEILLQSISNVAREKIELFTHGKLATFNTDFNAVRKFVTETISTWIDWIASNRIYN